MANTTLTREYFDKAIGNFSKSVDKRFKEQNKDLKDHVSKEVGELAAMSAREFHRVHDEFGEVYGHLTTMNRKLNDIGENQKGHEKRLTRVEKAIGIPEAV